MRRLPPFLILALILLILPFSMLPVHAVSTYIGYPVTTPGVASPSGDATGEGFGVALKSPFAGNLFSVTWESGVVPPDKLVILTRSAAGDPSSTVATCGTGNHLTCYEELVGNSWTVGYTTAVTGVTTNAWNTLPLPLAFSVSANEWVAVILMNTAQNTFPFGMIQTCDQETCGNGGGVSEPTPFHIVGFTFGTSNPSGNYNSADCSNNTVCAADWNMGATFQTAGTPSSAVTQCYGNCGNPVITLANTNSTGSVNFNNSITLLYMAQSNLNGVVKNVTSQIARTYTSGLTVQLGLYTVDPFCTATANPFTPQCPGFLQSQNSFLNPAKGPIVMLTSLQVVNGEWLGFSITATFQGLDVNDTNTNVQLFQTSGQTPTVISQTLSLSNNKMALYGYVTGNPVIVGPGNNQVGSGCETVTCGLQAFWLALGGDAAAGIVAFIVLFGLIGGTALYMTRQHDSEGRIRGFALPMSVLEILALLLLIMLSVAGVLPAWIPLTIIIFAAGSFVGLFVFNRSRNREQAA